MADTRQRILDTAQDLFIELGYERTSLRAIAEKIGITKAALYYYFPSKEALLDALISPTFEFLRSVVPGILATTDVDEWSRLIGQVIDWLVGQRSLFLLVQRNQSVIGELAHDSESFARHEDIHQAFELMASNPAVPIETRIRLMSALGVATSLVETGGALLADPPDVVARTLRGLVDAVLYAELPATVPAG